MIPVDTAFLFPLCHAQTIDVHVTKMNSVVSLFIDREAGLVLSMWFVLALVLNIDNIL